MNEPNPLPRVLIIDDLFGRTHPDRRNEERSNLCGQYLLEDMTGDEIDKGSPQKIKNPIAQAVFHRGQKPICSTVGDIVENDLEAVVQAIQSGWLESKLNRISWALVLLDLNFYTGRVTDESNRKSLGMPAGRDEDRDPDRYFGLKILELIQEEFPGLPVLILSSKPREEVSREFSLRGAFGFLPRVGPESPGLLKEYIWRHGLIQDDLGKIIGKSKSLLVALRAARKYSRARQNILIRGERGTGKELLAAYINRTGNAQLSPFVAINSALLTPELFESELFGIESGVATSVTKRQGRLLDAAGGDVFFDEVKDMLPQVQAGLLRVLQDKKVTPTGSKQQYVLDLRFLSATNADIEAMAAVGTFRSDLLDRLREGGTIYLPPLRERKDDIPLLVEKFVREAEHEDPRALRREIHPQAIDKLLSYEWPGNIRELESCIRSAVTNYPDVEYLVPAHLNIDEIGFKTRSSNDVGNEMPSSSGMPRSEGPDLDGLISAIATFKVESLSSARLAGKLGRLQAAYAHLIAKYLEAVLTATKKPGPKEPDGKILIHPAVKLLTGDSDISGSKAADLIKRLLSIDPSVTESLLSNPILREAYETAVRLRPKTTKQKMIVADEIQTKDN